jgi:peroxiredoxin
MKIFYFLILSLFISTNTTAQTLADSMLTKYNKLPPAKILSLDSTNITLAKMFKKDKPTVLLFFSPDCSHCKEEIAMLKSNSDSLKDINFVLISNRPPFLLRAFVKENNLAQYKNMVLVSDYGNPLTRYYGVATNPSMFIYNNKNKCVAGYLSSIVPAKIIMAKARS